MVQVSSRRIPLPNSVEIHQNRWDSSPPCCIPFSSLKKKNKRIKPKKKESFTIKKISTRRPTTTNRSEAERTCNASLIGMSAIQHAAAMATKGVSEGEEGEPEQKKGKSKGVASEGEFISARVRLRVAQRMLQRCKYNGTIHPHPSPSIPIHLHPHPSPSIPIHPSISSIHY